MCRGRAKAKRGAEGQAVNTLSVLRLRGLFSLCVGPRSSPWCYSALSYMTEPLGLWSCTALSRACDLVLLNLRCPENPLRLLTKIP
jgi:hypothetical protein